MAHTQQTATATVRDNVASSLIQRLSGNGPARREHVVRLYEDGASLSNTVADVVADGLAREDSCLLIATREHLNGITGELNKRGHDCGVLQ